MTFPSLLDTLEQMVADAPPAIFQGEGAFVKLGHFEKHFVKNSRKKDPGGKISEFFLLDTLQTTFWMVNLTWGRTQSGPFFCKIRALFLIFRKGQGRPETSYVANIKSWFQFTKHGRIQVCVDSAQPLWASKNMLKCFSKYK